MNALVLFYFAKNRRFSQAVDFIIFPLHDLNSLKTNTAEIIEAQKSDKGKAQYTPYNGRISIALNIRGRNKSAGIKNKIWRERLTIVACTGLPIAWKNCPPIN